MEAVEQINNETEFLGVPGEGHPWAASPDTELARLAERDTGIVLIALDGPAIVGYLLAIGGWYERNRGNVFIAVVGLREPYRGRGIGTRLFEAIEDWARGARSVAPGIEGQLAEPARPGALQEAGVRDREARSVPGCCATAEWTDDFWMGKLLDPAPPSDGGSEACAGSRPAGRHATHTLRVVREMQPRRRRGLSRLGDAHVRREPRSRSSSRPRWPRAEAVERDIADEPEDPRLWLVAVQQDMYGPEAIMAFASGSIERRFRMNHDAFVGINVLPEWAGQGLGRRLHNRIEAWARGQGVRRLTANIQAPNLAGHRFAAAMGYGDEVVMRGQSRIDGMLVDRLRLGKLLV